METLIISPLFFQESAARAIQVRKLCAGLQAKNYSFVLATFNTGNKKRDGISIIELTSKKTYKDWFFNGPLNKNFKLISEHIVEKNIKNVFAIATPLFSVILGYYLKKKFKNIRLITYFSDPLPVNNFPKPYFKGYTSLPNRIKLGIQKKLVKKILKLSDKVIIPSQKAKTYHEKINRIHLGEKAVVINHIGGVYKGIKINEPEPYIAYFGDLYNRISPEFIIALKKFHENHPDKFKGLICYGTSNTEALRKKVENYNACNLLQIKPPVSFQKSLKLMQKYRALLLIEANMPESPFIPSKYFDYLFANRPIMAVTPKNNALSDIYNEADVVMVTHNVNDIYNALNRVYDISFTPIKRELPNLQKDKIIADYLEVLLNEKSK